MTIKVFAWPPVGANGWEWTEVAPITSSRSLTTEREFTATSGRKRRMASLSVSAMSANGAGAGYMEMMKRLLEGVNAVRLRSKPINSQKYSSKIGGVTPVRWTADDTQLDWTAGASDLLWFSGTVFLATTTTSGGYPAVSVTGLPPSTLVARPGEFIRLFADSNGGEHVSQVLAPAYSDENGAALIKVLDALPSLTEVPVNFGDRASAVFKPISYPRAVQPVRGDWTYDWQFREVFADEVGGFEEVDPW